MWTFKLHGTNTTIGSPIGFIIVLVGDHEQLATIMGKFIVTSPFTVIIVIGAMFHKRRQTCHFIRNVSVKYEKLDKPDSQTTKSSNDWNYKKLEEGADDDGGGNDGYSQKNSD